MLPYIAYMDPMGYAQAYARAYARAYAITILTYARVGVWDSLTRHLRDLNCPKCIAYYAAAGDMLTGMRTHGLPPWIYHRNAYASLRNPGFCLRQTAILQLLLSKWREVLDPAQLFIMIPIFESFISSASNSDSQSFCLAFRKVNSTTTSNYN